MPLTMKQRRLLHDYNDKPDFPVGIVCLVVAIGILLFSIWERT